MQDKSKDSIARIIKQQRILLELTQDELGKKVGVSHSLIGRIERGERFPSARTLRKLANVLDISEVELFIHADFLSQPVSSISSRAIDEDMQTMKLDRKVLFELSRESLKTQRTVLAILKMLKSLAEDIAAEKVDDSIQSEKK